MPGSMRRRKRRRRSLLSRALLKPPAAGNNSARLQTSSFEPHAFGAGRSRLEREIADSYVCGVADAPLLGDTIGRSLDRAARRWADREALVSPSHGVRWTWQGTRRAGRCAGRGLSRARPRTRRADRRLVAEPAGMDADAVCRRQGRAHSRHHQSGLPPERTRIRARQGRLRRDRHGDRVQDPQLHGDAEHADAGTGDMRSRANCARRGCRNCAR